MLTTTLYQLLAVVVCWLLAGIFALALWHKLRAWPRFVAALSAYQLVPAALLTGAAVLVAVAEALCVVLLLLLQPAGAVGAALMLGIYLLAMSINMVRGKRHIDCGCGDTPTPLSMSLLGRNVILIILCSWPLWPTLTSIVVSNMPSLWFAASAAALTVVWLLLYLSVDQLLANRGIHQRLWAPAMEGH